MADHCPGRVAVVAAGGIPQARDASPRRFLIAFFPLALTHSTLLVAGATSALAIVTLSTGCQIVGPVALIPIPSQDQPPSIAAALPAEFVSGEGETLVLAVRYRGGEPGGWMGGMLDPLFVKTSELPDLAKRLESTVYNALLYPPDAATVSELCMVASTGRTLSMRLKMRQWVASEIGFVNAAWRDTFTRTMSGQPSWGRGRPPWRSGPCTQVDWSRYGVLVGWTDEQRARVNSFLRELPLQR